MESGYIEEMIQDLPFSPFPQILTTERPDVAAACLLEGRVVAEVIYRHLIKEMKKKGFSQV